MDDGRKCHIKFYLLLIAHEDGRSWDLYTYQNAYLSVSPNKWSPTDLSSDTQVTIVRHPELAAEIKGWCQHWAAAYSSCKAGVATVIERAIMDGRKLQGRPGQKQFEVFSSDWMIDVHGKAWLFEFNMTPAICQHGFALKNDEKLMRDALEIVIPSTSCSSNSGSAETAPSNAAAAAAKRLPRKIGLWDPAGQFTGPAMDAAAHRLHDEHVGTRGERCAVEKTSPTG